MALLALEGRGSGPPPAPPPALVIAPKVVGFVRGPTGSTYLAFSPDGKTLAVNHGEARRSDGDGSSLLLWEVASLRCRRSEELPPADRNDWHQFAFTPDGRRLAVGSNGTALLWNLAGRNVEMRFGKEAAAMHWLTVSVSPDGRTLAVVWPPASHSPTGR